MCFVAAPLSGSVGDVVAAILLVGGTVAGAFDFSVDEITLR
jgi:hypothetical protein